MRIAINTRLVVLLFLLGAAALSLWLADALRKAVYPIGTAPVSRHTPDYYLVEFTATGMDTLGTPQHRLTADHLVHYGDDGTAELEQPRLTVYRRDARTWQVDAASGWVSGDGNLVVLGGAVEILRIDSRDLTRTLTIDTHDLEVFLDRNFVQTDATVTIRAQMGTTEAVGMNADLERGRLRLLSDVRGIYEPPRD